MEVSAAGPVRPGLNLMATLTLKFPDRTLEKPGSIGALGQTIHRMELGSHWNIGPGYGKGDCTAVLATAVGDT